MFITGRKLPQACIKITHGSIRYATFLVSMAIFAYFLTKKTSKSPILANIPPSLRKHLVRLYHICTLQVYIIKIWRESVLK